MQGQLSTPVIAVLPGDGIGPEVIRQAVKVLEALRSPDFDFQLAYAPVGAAAIDLTGHPLPEATAELALRADAVLFGAVGDARYDSLAPSMRPEKAILGLRRSLGLYACLKAVRVPKELAHLSPLRSERVEGTNLLVVRELDGDAYTGQPKGERRVADGPFAGQRQGYDSMQYAEGEVVRVARMAFEAARCRSKRVCSVDKANVLASSRLWRSVVNEVAAEYPDVTLTHAYADNAAIQLISDPRSFDVLLTGNLFGDILTDVASTLTGSIGLSASALLGAGRQGMFEAGHGTAVDIAGQDLANPLACIRAMGLVLEHSLGRGDLASRVEIAVDRTLMSGLRTRDLAGSGPHIGTEAMGDEVVARLRATHFSNSRLRPGS